MGELSDVEIAVTKLTMREIQAHAENIAPGIAIGIISIVGSIWWICTLAVPWPPVSNSY